MSANEPYIGKGNQIRVTDVVEILHQYRNSVLTYDCIRRLGEAMDKKAREPI